MKIYDCFTFFNELDLLEMRLNILKDDVDKFILVEGEKTFQGKEKEMIFEKNKSLFKDFADKIIYIPVKKEEFVPNAWQNEAYTFNKMSEGLNSCEEEDIVLISALDEIPKPELLKEIKHKNLLNIIKIDEIKEAHLEMKLFYFYLNTKYKEINFSNKSSWIGTYLTKYKYISSEKNLYEKAIKRRRLSPVITNCGWHFSFLGDEKQNITKINSYSHSEFNHLKQEEIKKNIENLKDPLSRINDANQTAFDGFEPLELLPQYIQENKEKFSKYIREQK